MFSASSREKLNVAWVKSFVPKLKNSARSARVPARMQARTTSIIVPNENGTEMPKLLLNPLFDAHD